MIYDKVIDIKEVKERFMGNYSLYSNFLFQFRNNLLFNELKRNIKENNVKDAYEISNSLKGVIVSLSLKLLSPLIYNIVDTLKLGNLPSEDEWDNFVGNYRITVEAIKRLEEENIKLF